MVFTEMLDALARFTDDEISQFADPSALRVLFMDWAQELRRDASGSG